MSLEHIERHFGEAVTALIGPFWGKPVIAALLRSYINRVQELEDDCAAVLTAFDINTCDETRLKVLAKIVGQFNAGWDLETFRAVVRAKIATNRSHGREDDLINVLRLITGSAAPIAVEHLVPATVSIEMGEPVSAEHMTAIAFLLPKARAAGVRLNFIAPVEGSWIFDSAGSPLADASTFDSSVTPDPDAGTFASARTL